MCGEKDREKSSMTPRFLARATVKMELPFTKILTTNNNDIYLSRFVLSKHRTHVYFKTIGSYLILKVPP